MYESHPEEFPFPEGAITIDEFAPDGTTVTFSVYQKWKEGETISWIGKCAR